MKTHARNVPRPLTQAAGGFHYCRVRSASASFGRRATANPLRQPRAGRAARKPRPPADLTALSHAIDLTGYDASLLTEYLGVRKLANLRKLVDLARQFDQSGALYAGRFHVDRPEEDAVADETHEPLAATHPESSDVIRPPCRFIQSKGLEFPIVIVADCDRKTRRSGAPVGHFDPNLGPLVSLPEKFGESADHLECRMFRQSERDEDLAESRRLFYVAATRASDLFEFSRPI